jgi:hypothetical protein
MTPALTTRLGEGQTVAGLAFFRSLNEAFACAADAAGGSLERVFGLGGVNLRLRVAGAELGRVFLPALRHLGAPRPDRPIAMVSAWDTDSSGVPVPPFPWSRWDVRERGEIRGFNTARIRTVYHGDLTVPDLGFHALSMCDLSSRSAIFWVQGCERLPWWEHVEPLRPALHWTLSGPSLHFVHAACVSNADGGVLIAGKGGSGKSTTALACVNAGYGFLGDNYVLLATNGGRPVAHCLFGNVKVRNPTLALLPGSANAQELRDENGEERYIIDVAREHPDLIRRETLIEALVVPRLVASGQTRIRQGSPAEGLLALAPSTIFQLPGDGRGAFHTMTELVKSVPTYVVELGGDPAEAPPVIAGLLRSLRRRRTASR